ncbi:MAG: Ig-like domain-containing protein [Sneathiella sp.]
MRVFGILVFLLLVGAALFLLWGNDDPVLAERPIKPAGKIQEDTKLVVSEKTDKTNAVIIEKENQPTVAKGAIAAMASPRFDVVRVDENCGLLVAGRAEPTAVLQIYAGENVLGSVTADRRGEWVFVSDAALTAGAQKINVKAKNPDGREVETARLVVMQVPDCSKNIENRQPAIAILTPKNKDHSAFDKRVSKLLQMPEPKGDLTAAKNLSVGSIDYNDTGNVALSGQGTPGNDVQVYVQNKPVGTAKVDKDGNWSLTPETEIPAGKYKLRADQLDQKGNVISRVELPFQRASADDVILAKGGLEIRAIVQPGNSLWRIARRMYGEGTEYTMIYQANQEQIKDPNLIFPGQIFKLPSEKVPN